MTRTRFLTGSLATLAIASAITLATPAAQAAEERGCGQPEVAAVYETVVRPAVVEIVPAVTHDEWLWGRDITISEFEFTRLLQPAAVENSWGREVAGPVEHLFTRRVIDSPAVPAVPAVPEVGHFEDVVTVPAVTSTEIEYRHENTGNLRWEDTDWGAQNGNGNGWEPTGNTREVEVVPAVTVRTWIIDVPAIPAVPAVPEVWHEELTWATAAPGSDWTGPIDTRPGPTSTERATTAGPQPAGEGWQLLETREIPAVHEIVWASVAPDDATPTGASRVTGTSREETASTTAIAPEGDGWSRIEGSGTTVVDSPEQTVLVTPEVTEEVLVSPAVPASEPCVLPPHAEDETDQTGGNDPVVSVAAPTAAQGGAGPVGTVLPNTGNGVPPWMAPTGLAVMLAGVGVIRMSRRTAD